MGPKSRFFIFLCRYKTLTQNILLTMEKIYKLNVCLSGYLSLSSQYHTQPFPQCKQKSWAYSPRQPPSYISLSPQLCLEGNGFRSYLFFKRQYSPKTQWVPISFPETSLQTMRLSLSLLLASSAEIDQVKGCLDYIKESQLTSG